MSRAIPSSLSEYLFTTTNPDNLIINGGIMPLRNGSPDSIDWKYCLRGEDHVFLGEALNVRGWGYNRPPHKQIAGTYIWEIMDSMRSLWNSNLWSATRPVIPAGVVADASAWWDYCKQYLYLPTQQSAGETYTVLDAEQIMRLFKDMKQLNYTIDTASRGNSVPYDYTQSCTYTFHEEEHRPDYQPAPADYDETSTNYLWYEQEDVIWEEGEGYPGDVMWRRTANMKSSSLTFTERTSSTPNLKKTCVEIMPYAEMEVANVGSTFSSGSGGTGDNISEYKYVVVPLKSGYTDMLNETFPSVNSSELNAAIDLAYSTANLAKRAVDIPLTPATPPYEGARTYRYATSTCRIWTLFYLIHFKYCSLENVNIP